MSVELRPLNVKCNIQCQYCYQNPQRDAAKSSTEYDMDKMKAAILAEGGPFTIFGGEPLLIPMKDLEELLAWGYAQYGRNGIQTNGTLITDEHIHLFRKFNVHVGISLDGPDELNDARWHSTLATTRKSTRTAHDALERLCIEGLSPSVIVTLHRVNASLSRLPRLLEWVRHLDALGVKHVRLHLLESENRLIRQTYGLSSDENLEVLRQFIELEKHLVNLSFDLFPEMRRLLRGDDRITTCVWYACDPYTTHAVRGVEGQGQRTNCGRTNKDGIDFVKGSAEGFERSLALYHTPQEAGGCAGCRYFLMCRGQCPGTAIDGDWRNRSEHCGVWMGLFALLEAELEQRGEQVLSRDEKLPLVETMALQTWASGRRVNVYSILSSLDRGSPLAENGGKI